MDTRSADGRTWIESALGFSAAEFASSPHGCQARLLEAVGSDLTYEDLVGYSAFAFRTNVHRELCPSSGHPFCGYVCIEGSNRALPWKMQLFESPPWEAPKDDREAFEADACAAIKDSIDRGVPVHYGSEEDGLIVGYADEGRRWWCVHPYFEAGGEAFWHDEAQDFAGGSWPWGIVTWTEPKPAAELASGRDLLGEALEQAVDMWHTERRDDYFVGDAAYAHWISWLRGVDEGRIREPGAGMQGNGWCYDVLIQCRRIAGRWLSGQADGLDDVMAAPLRRAADDLTAIADTCMEGFDCPWDLALGPDRECEWTSEMRQKQLARLERSRELDRSAVAAFTEALASAN